MSLLVSLVSLMSLLSLVSLTNRPFPIRHYLSPLVSRSQTQPSATRWEGSGQPSVSLARFLVGDKPLIIFIMTITIFITILPPASQFITTNASTVQYSGLTRLFPSCSRGLGLATRDY